MNENKKVNVLLKAGIATNAVYLVLLLVQFVLRTFVNPDYLWYLSGQSYFARVYFYISDVQLWNYSYSRGPSLLDVLVVARHLINNLFDKALPVLYPVIGPLMDQFPERTYYFIVWSLIICYCLVFFSIALLGMRKITQGNKRKGATLALIGMVGFFPIGIIGMIGAWQELRAATKDETSAAPAGTGPTRTLPGVGDLFRRSASLSLQRFPQLMGAIAVTLVAVIVVTIVPMMLIDSYDYKIERALNIFMRGSLGGYSLDRVLLPVLPLLVALSCIALWGTALAIRIVSADKGTGFLASVGAATKKLGQVLWVSVLILFCLAGGYTLLFVPGFIINIWLMFGLYVLIAGEVSGMRALVMSREYVRGRWWPVFGRFLLMWLLVWIVGTVSTKIVEASPSALGMLLLLGVNILAGTFMIVYLYQLYLDLKQTRTSPVSAEQESRTTKLLLGTGALGAAVLGIIFLAFS